jgi:branched-chain amino acid transport system permease protein
LGLSMPVAFVLAMISVALIGVLLERGPIRLSRNRDVLTLVMITVGASISFRGASMLIWGKSERILPPLGGDTPITIFSAVIMPQTLWILGISCVVLAALFLFYQFTLVGKAMRAVADNPYGAQLIGISVLRMVGLAFAMSGAMGALAGILITPLTGMNYSAGLMLGLKGFAGAILGGYGSTPGAVVGGLLLGVLEALGAGFISSACKDAFAFLVLLAILFVRPAGLFGTAPTKRL